MPSGIDSRRAFFLSDPSIYPKSDISEKRSFLGGAHPRRFAPPPRRVLPPFGDGVPQPFANEVGESDTVPLRDRFQLPILLVGGKKNQPPVHPRLRLRNSRMNILSRTKSMGHSLQGIRDGPGFILVACELAGRAIPVALDQPLFVVLVLEPLEGSLQVFETRIRFRPERIFLGKADESLGADLALGRANEGRGRADPQPTNLVLEGAAG